MLEADNYRSFVPEYTSHSTLQKIKEEAEQRTGYPREEFILEHLYRDRNLEDMDIVINQPTWMELDHLEWWMQQVDHPMFQLQYLMASVVYGEDPKPGLLTERANILLRTFQASYIHCKSCGASFRPDTAFELRTGKYYFAMHVPHKCFCDTSEDEFVRYKIIQKTGSGQKRMHKLPVTTMPNGIKDAKERWEKIKALLE